MAGQICFPCLDSVAIGFKYVLPSPYLLDGLPKLFCDCNHRETSFMPSLLLFQGV